jgi:hypothetical protein
MIDNPAEFSASVIRFLSFLSGDTGNDGQIEGARKINGLR